MTRPTNLRARYVFPVAGEPIADGLVSFVDGRIVAVGRRRAGATAASCEDLGNVAILPGLVNAHAHLDFSDLPAPLGQRGIVLADWIRRVMAYRREAAERLPSAVNAGLRESARRGVTTLADMVQPRQPGPTDAPLSVTAFVELIAPTRDRVADAMALAREHLDGCHTRQAASSLLSERSPGLCPHAPYSVHPELLAAIVGLSSTERAPVAMHLAESLDELQLLQTGSGPFREFLDELDAAAGRRSATYGGGLRPMDFLRTLAAAHRALIVHGNYLTDDEIAFLGAQAARMAVVYCPRSHDWFAHRDYPLAKMLAAGVRVALGTDGRCSTPDLDMLAEMRFAARRHPGVGFEQILEMGTIQGAAALAKDGVRGSLVVGKRADLAVVALPDRDAADPHALLFDSDRPVVGCYVGGQRVILGD
ncbi:MAG: amidohydrolase family protein [Thermoguttaceae bacterium]